MVFLTLSLNCLSTSSLATCSASRLAPVSTLNDMNTKAPPMKATAKEIKAAKDAPQNDTVPAMEPGAILSTISWLNSGRPTSSATVANSTAMITIMCAHHGHLSGSLQFLHLLIIELLSVNVTIYRCSARQRHCTNELPHR